MTAFIAAIVSFLVLGLPGFIVALRARAGLGVVLAAGIGAAFLAMLSTAIAAEILGGLTAWSIYIVALLFAAVAFFAGRGQPLDWPRIDPLQLALPVFCTAITFAVYSLAFKSGTDPLIFRAWFNADWFKHLGHVHAVANYGLPAADIFGGLEKLHYYWLFYLIPAAPASLHGDVEGALIAANLVTIFLFWLLLQELLRACGLGIRGAALLAFAGWAMNAITGIGILAGYGFNLRALIDEISVDPGLLMEVNSYIPQHATMLCGFLAFLLLFLRSGELRHWRIFAFAPIIAAGATSTLLGASVVAISCSVILLLGRGTLIVRAAQSIGVGLAALAVVFGLQIVVPALDQGSMGSPVFDSFGEAAPAATRLSSFAMQTLVTLSIALPLGLLGIFRAIGLQDRALRDPAAIAALTLLVAFGASCAATLLFDDARLASELVLRNRYLPVIALLMGIALLYALPARADRERPLFTGGLIAIVALSLPTVIMNFAWLGWSGPRWQLEIPRADMEAMIYLREHAAVDAMVQQFPEPVSFRMGGRDTWVPIFAGRAVVASYRSTSWALTEPVMDEVQSFYGSAPGIDPVATADWVYLSRSLHPESYDRLRARLGGDAQWEERFSAAGASLYARRQTGNGERGSGE